MSNYRDASMEADTDLGYVTAEMRDAAADHAAGEQAAAIAAERGESAARRFQAGDRVTILGEDGSPFEVFVVFAIAESADTEWNVAIARESDYRRGGCRWVWVHPDALRFVTS